jgi:F-type H+-transporting ATPase subunit gamma
MPSLKELRNRIRSVGSTQKITQAMKMVAASKLRRAQEQAQAARPYAEQMEHLLALLAASIAEDEFAPRLLKGSGKDDVHLIIVATADRGLCGPFNSSIVRAARRHIRELSQAGKTVKLMCVGRKGRDMLRRDHGGKIIESLDFAGTRQMTFGYVQPIAEQLTSLFEEGEIDVCTIFYNHFRSVMSQVVTAQQLIPVEPPAAPAGETNEAEPLYYEYESEESEILEALLPRNIAVQIYRALLENMASEQGARMTAMDNASRNAGEMIDALTLRYNRTRQAMITKELIEIISGAEAV